MANKRIEKKHKQKAEKKTLSAKYSPKEVKTMSAGQRTSEAKRITKNEARKQSRAESREFLLKQGLSSKFINRYQLYNKKPSSYTAHDLLVFAKMDELEKHGYKYTKTDVDRLGWVKLQEKYPKISIPDYAEKQKQRNIEKKTFLCKDFLYVAAAEVRVGFYRQDFSHLTSDEIGSLIMERLKEAMDDIEGSDDLYCIFVYDFGSREAMTYKANVFYRRGYNLDPAHIKLETRQYSKITLSNKWKQKEFLDMILNCVNQMKNEQVVDFIDTMMTYCKRNSLPFMSKVK